MDDRSGLPSTPPSEPGPQDDRVDRRTFLQRVGTLAAAVTAGTIPPVRLVGVPSEPDSFRQRTESATRIFGRLDGASAGVAQTDPAELTAAEAGALIRSGDLAPSELLEAFLTRIRSWDRVFMAFNEVPAEESRARARELDGGRLEGLLHGIPVAVKDNFHTRGVRTTANSWIYADFVPESDATAVSRIRGAGGVLLGKTQMGPLATTRALTPDGAITTVNAWAPREPVVSPGGSSSGSATAVAARLAPVAIGTQTGGSITSPALAQGLTGLKPTLGRVSVAGIVPLTYTRDHPGPLARDARDAALLLQAMAGPDPADPRTLGLPPVPDYLGAVVPVEERGRPVLRWATRVGVPPGWASEQDPALRGDRTRFLASLEELGALLVELPVPEGWEELSRPELNAARLPERSELYLDVLRRDVRLFGVALSSWIHGLLLSGDEYMRAQRARSALLGLALDEVFTRCDVAIQPGSLPFDMIGLPLISFPIGFRERPGGRLPHGVIVGGAPFGEERLLALAAGWQEVSEWHRHRPPILPVEEARADSFQPGSRGRLGIESVAERSE